MLVSVETALEYVELYLFHRCRVQKCGGDFRKLNHSSIQVDVLSEEAGVNVDLDLFEQCFTNSTIAERYGYIKVVHYRSMGANVPFKTMMIIQIFFEK